VFVQPYPRWCVVESRLGHILAFIFEKSTGVRGRKTRKANSDCHSRFILSKLQAAVAWLGGRNSAGTAGSASVCLRKNSVQHKLEKHVETLCASHSLTPPRKASTQVSRTLCTVHRLSAWRQKSAGSMRLQGFDSPCLNWRVLSFLFSLALPCTFRCPQTAAAAPKASATVSMGRVFGRVFGRLSVVDFEHQCSDTRAA
jgi:hypothetical protein